MTKVSSIPFQQTGYFSKTICDYLEEKQSLQNFYGNFPSIENFEQQLLSKKQSFSTETRTVLVNALREHYSNLKISEKTAKNIDALASENTFTITTGHQLNLFTGPLYFLYKILSAINLSEQLKQRYSDYDFVPVYWMASEDHDFEEICYFNFKGKKMSWNRDSKGAVGRLSTAGLEQVLEEFSSELGGSKNARALEKLFKAAYLEHDNLTDATRFLANELFAEYGLVILDGDHSALKRQFLPYVKEELERQNSYQKVSETVAELSANYKIQVNPRELNLFYLTDGLRARITKEGNIFKVLNTSIEFSQDELDYELKLHPERFSPNVILRPLYQEVILPNLCYIGGGGELAYWFELKSYFESVKIPLPILLLRNSAVLISEKQGDKLKKLNISTEELFLKQLDLVNKKITEHSDVIIDFSSQRQQIDSHFDMLEEIAAKTDKSFIGAVKAQKKKQLNGLDNLERRLLKAERRTYKDLAQRIAQLQDELFPKQSLQERNTNFSEHFLEYGDHLIPELKKALNPFDLAFTIVQF